MDDHRTKIRQRELALWKGKEIKSPSTLNRSFDQQPELEVMKCTEYSRLGDVTSLALSLPSPPLNCQSLLGPESPRIQAG